MEPYKNREFDNNHCTSNIFVIDVDDLDMSNLGPIFPSLSGNVVLLSSRLPICNC